jgi:hypothetical protein
MEQNALFLVGCHPGVYRLQPAIGDFRGRPGVTLWRWAGLALVLFGLWVGRREQALVPWLLFLATKVITTLGFFGYAREGAVVIPVFALLLALLAARGLPAREKASPNTGRWLQLTAVIAVVLIAVEAYRWHSEPVVTLDGRDVSAGDPFPGLEYEERQLLIK